MITFPLTSDMVQYLLEHPDRFRKEYVGAIKEGRKDHAAQLAIALGEPYCDAGLARVALGVFKFYLKKWGRSEDEYTGEILSLAGNAASHLGEEQRAEQLLQRLRRLAEKNGRPLLLRRALQSLGVLRHQQRRTDERDRFYEEALKVARASDDRLGQAQLYNNIGAGCLDAGRIAEGERLLWKSVEIKTQMGCDLDAARSHVTLGGLLARQRRFKAAATMLKSSARVARKHGDQRLLATALYNLGKLEEDRGQLARSPRLLRAALAHAQLSDDPHAIKLCEQGLAVTYSKMDRPALAAPHFETLGRLCQQLGDDHGTAMAHHDLGSMLALQGKVADARREYQTAVSQFKVIGDRRWHAISLMSLAKQTSDTEEAADLVRQAVDDAMQVGRDPEFPAPALTDLAIRIGEPRLVQHAIAVEWRWLGKRVKGWAKRVAVLGAMARHHGHLSVAEALFRRSERLHASKGDREGEGAVLNDLGIALLEQAKPAQAKRCFVRAVQMARRMRNRVLLAQSAHNLGEAHRRSGDGRLALRSLAEAARASRAVEDRDSEAGTLHSQGLTMLALGRHAEAASVFAELAMTARRLRSPFHRGQAAIGAGDVQFAQARYEDAYAHYREARYWFEEGDCHSQRRVAMYDMGLAARKLGKTKESSRLMMRSASLAAKALDHSMLATALQGLARLTAEHGTVRQTASLIANALLAALASEDRLESYPTSLASYRDLLRILIQARKTTPQTFQRMVVAKCGGGPVGDLIRTNLAQLNSERAVAP